MTACFRLYIRPAVDCYAERLGNIALTAQEACRDQQQIDVDCGFASIDRHHFQPSGRFILLGVQLHEHRLLQPSVLIADQLFHGCLINSRIAAVHRGGFLLTVIGLADARPFRPRIILGSGIGELGHHLELDDALRAVTNAGADTVVAGIAAPDDQDVLVLCGDIGSLLQAVIEQRLGGRSQEINRKIHALCISSIDRDIARMRSAAREDHAVILGE